MNKIVIPSLGIFLQIENVIIRLVLFIEEICTEISETRIYEKLRDRTKFIIHAAKSVID